MNRGAVAPRMQDVQNWPALQDMAKQLNQSDIDNANKL
jgi:hypothetical protein